MSAYRVIPPQGLALPDVLSSPEQAHHFFKMHYFGEATEHNFRWYWLEKVRPMEYGDFIVPSMLSGLMRERMAELGIDDSNLPDQLGETLETIARHYINEYTRELGLDIPGWVVEEKRRVECAE